MKRVVNEMHMKDVTITYGMTETSPGRYVSLSCALFLHSRASHAYAAHSRRPSQLPDRGKLSAGEASRDRGASPSPHRGTYYNAVKQLSAAIWLTSSDLIVCRQCKIVDTEGRTVPVGHVGELCTKGYARAL